MAKLSGVAQTTITGLSEGIFWDFKNDKPSQTLFDYCKIDKSLVLLVTDIKAVLVTFIEFFLIPRLLLAHFYLFLLK